MSKCKGLFRQLSLLCLSGFGFIISARHTILATYCLLFTAGCLLLDTRYVSVHINSANAHSHRAQRHSIFCLVPQGITE